MKKLRRFFIKSIIKKLIVLVAGVVSVTSVSIAFSACNTKDKNVPTGIYSLATNPTKGEKPKDSYIKIEDNKNQTCYINNMLTITELYRNTYDDSVVTEHNNTLLSYDKNDTTKTFTIKKPSGQKGNITSGVWDGDRTLTLDDDGSVQYVR